MLVPLQQICIRSGRSVMDERGRTSGWTKNTRCSLSSPWENQSPRPHILYAGMQPFCRHPPCRCSHVHVSAYWVHILPKNRRKGSRSRTPTQQNLHDGTHAHTHTRIFTRKQSTTEICSEWDGAESAARACHVSVSVLQTQRLPDGG